MKCPVEVVCWRKNWLLLKVFVGGTGGGLDGEIGVYKKNGREKFFQKLGCSIVGLL